MENIEDVESGPFRELYDKRDGQLGKIERVGVNALNLKNMGDSDNRLSAMYGRAHSPHWMWDNVKWRMEGDEKNQQNPLADDEVFNRLNEVYDHIIEEYRKIPQYRAKCYGLHNYNLEASDRYDVLADKLRKRTMTEAEYEHYSTIDIEVLAEELDQGHLEEMRQWYKSVNERGAPVGSQKTGFVERVLNYLFH
ncbi:MAG: hypothetical protein KC506_03215 [Nanoarchaeota archaeon]|nr:hypothetical protein [Nanoarchaeota archaeon]